MRTFLTVAGRMIMKEFLQAAVIIDKLVYSEDSMNPEELGDARGLKYYRPF